MKLIKPLRQRIADGHPWIYDKALGRVDATSGEVVEVVDDGGFVCTAFADPESPIRARVLALEPTEAGAAWVVARARAAVARRERDPLLVGCTGVRLVHGEADGCPGLVVDRYATTAVCVLDGPAAARFWRPRLPDVLAEVAAAHAWVKERGVRGGDVLHGDPPTEIVIDEDEARFAVDVRSGQKTGFFLDQRDNRRLVRRHAAGASVLNVFSYTGGFSLHAALGGAAAVTSVDSAAPAIAGVHRNLELSGLPAQDTACEDAFAFLARAARQGRRWDLVIVDPPSFAPSERAKGAALAAYRKLARAALAVVAPAGRFALASCSSHVTEADLLGEVAGAGLALRSASGAASDHPVLPAFPEGRYLKFLFFDVG